MQYIPEVRTIYNRLKASAKKRNIPFELELTNIWNLPIPLRCPILGIPLKFNRGKPQDDSVSVDRIDNEKGYVKDNICIISYRANVLKRNASKEELEALSSFYNQPTQELS